MSTDDVAALRAEVEDLQERALIRKKLGAGGFVTEAQVKKVLEEERRRKKKEAQKQKDQEAAETRERENTKRIMKAAVDLFDSGRIAAAVNGVRVKSIGEDLMLPCSFCGAGMVETVEPVFTFTQNWLSVAPEHRFDPGSPILVYSARNPLSHYIGSPTWFSPVKCRACGEFNRAIVGLWIL